MEWRRLSGISHHLACQVIPHPVFPELTDVASTLFFSFWAEAFLWRGEVRKNWKCLWCCQRGVHGPTYLKFLNEGNEQKKHEETTKKITRSF